MYQEQAKTVGLLDAFSIETGLVVAGGLALILLARLALGWLEGRRRVKPFVRHTALVGLTVVGLVAVALTLKDPVRDQVLRFLGILFTAVLAFSSTTLVGNGLAGVMLRTQRHFRGGDWVSVKDRFGQVSHRGLFFTTIQDELGDLVALPNVYLATHPVTVVSEPTFISAQVSLGYDIPRGEVERLLLEAADAAGLEKAYVYILELGDYSILYRVSGRLKKTDELLTRRSELKCRVLDSLHAGGIEIVSPAFMNQRVLAEDRQFVPATLEPLEPTVSRASAPEADTFAKARQARTIEQLEDAIKAADDRIAELRTELEECESEKRRDELLRHLDKLERGREKLVRQIEEKRTQANGE